MARKLGIALIVLLVAGMGFAQNNVTFNVNMSVQATAGNFNPTTDTVVVRGGTAPLAWDGYDNLLTDPEGDSIYSITLDFGSETGTVEYKYVMKPAGGSDDWESIEGNRTFDLTGSPLVLDTVYFSNQSGVPVEGTVIFQVDLRVQEAVGNFSPGDHATVRGAPAPLAWDESAPEMQPWDTIYVAPVTFNMPRGSEIQYKYHICPDSLWGTGGGTWESGANRILVYDPDTLGVQMVPLRYFDDISPEDIIMQEVIAIFKVDLRYVFYAIAEQGYWYAEDALDTVYSVDSVYIAGGTSPLQWVWDQVVYPPELQMKDDGAYPDEIAGDSIYTVFIAFPMGSPKRIEHKYGVNGLDNELGFAQNHFITMSDAEAIFHVPLELFGSLIWAIAANDDENGVSLQDGEVVTAKGVVTVANEFGSYGPSYIQDLAAGLAVYDATFTSSVSIGNEVLLTGTVSNYNGLTELADITSFEVLNEGVSYDTLLITCADLADTVGEAYEGRLVKIENVTTTEAFPDAGSNANITITDATGSCTMRIDKDTDIDGTTAPTGAFNVVGVVTQYDSDSPYWSGYQIMPRTLGDILVGIEEEEGSPKVYALSQNYPNPFSSGTTIKYQLAKSGNVSIGIYNLLGERIATLVDEPQKAGYYDAYWNGKDSKGNKIACGIYFCRMDVKTESGNSSFTRTRKLVMFK